KKAAMLPCFLLHALRTRRAARPAALLGGARWRKRALRRAAAATGRRTAPVCPGGGGAAVRRPLQPRAGGAGGGSGRAVGAGGALRFGAESAQTCALRRVTLSAGGGWTPLPTPGGAMDRFERLEPPTWT